MGTEDLRSALEPISTAIALAAGLPGAVTLREGPQGSYTATVFAARCSGFLADVLVWAAQEARAQRLREDEERFA